MNIIVVDANDVFRYGLVGVLSSLHDFRVVADIDDLAKSMEITQELQPDLMLLDLDLLAGDEVEGIERILRICPKMKVVVLASEDAEKSMFRVLSAGACGYLLKNTHISYLIQMLEAVERGEVALSRVMTARLVKEFARFWRDEEDQVLSIQSLSHRELQVLRLLCGGATNGEIAEQLVISKNTVKIHVRKVLQKLQLSHRNEIRDFANRHGLNWDELERPE